MKREIQTIPCSTLISKLEAGTLRIPQFAKYKTVLRDKEESGYFMDSILKGYFSKVFLFWKTKERLRSMGNIGGSRLTNPPKEGFVHYVLDGQWYLTSLFAGMKGLTVHRGKYEYDFSEICVDLSAREDEQIVKIGGDYKNQHTIIKLKDLLSENFENSEKYPQELHDKIYMYRQKIQSFPFVTVIIKGISRNEAKEIFELVPFQQQLLTIDEIKQVKARVKSMKRNITRPIKKNKETDKKESGRTPRKKDNYELPSLCPVCGQELVDAPSGLWCLNPDCVVTDDCNLYMKNADEEL